VGIWTEAAPSLTLSWGIWTVTSTEFLKTIPEGCKSYTAESSPFDQSFITVISDREVPSGSELSGTESETIPSLDETASLVFFFGGLLSSTGHDKKIPTTIAMTASRNTTYFGFMIWD